MDKITLAHLKGACADQRALFQRTFPDGAPLTEEFVDTALKARLDILWLTHLLPPPARAKYMRARAPAWAKYQRTVTAEQADYESAQAAAIKELSK